MPAKNWNVRDEELFKEIGKILLWAGCLPEYKIDFKKFEKRLNQNNILEPSDQLYLTDKWGFSPFSNLLDIISSLSRLFAYPLNSGVLIKNLGYFDLFPNKEFKRNPLPEMVVFEIDPRNQVSKNKFEIERYLKLIRDAYEVKHKRLSAKVESEKVLVDETTEDGLKRIEKILIKVNPNRPISNTIDAMRVHLYKRGSYKEKPLSIFKRYQARTMQKLGEPIDKIKDVIREDKPLKQYESERKKVANVLKKEKCEPSKLEKPPVPHEEPEKYVTYMLKVLSLKS